MSTPIAPYKVGDAARAALAAGISIVPPMEDGSKRPLGAWKPYQQALPSAAQVEAWYGPRPSLGLITGAVSGGLELFELDADFYAEFKATAHAVGLGPLLTKIEAGYLERTPGGGWHLLYRCCEIRGNTKLAQRPGPPDPKTGKPTIEVLIETRGDHGYVVVAPSNGKVHPSGGRYELLSGGLEQLVEITGPEREQLWSLARTFDRMPISAKQSPLGRKMVVRASRPPGKGEGPRPGDDYNDQKTWDDILILRGWTRLHTSGETTYWRRPGKSDGISATTNHMGSGLLWVFTTSSEFDAERSYDLFGAYVTLEHGGSFEAAAKCLGEQGYGSPKRGGRQANDGRPGRPPEIATAAGGDPPDRPDVEINTERYLIVEETIRALGADPDLYRRGPFLVMVVLDNDDELKLTSKTTIKHLSGSPRIINLSDSVIGCYLTRNAKFFQWRTPPKGEPYTAPAHPPDWLIKAVATRNYWPGIRPLAAVVECPFPRPDGSIVETPGYDRATATLYLPTIDFPKLADHPTRDDARAAWGRFQHLVRQFPFPTEDDRVVALAGALTAIGRVAIAGPVPGFAVIGNKASTGKGLLIDCMVMPSIGRRAPTSSYPDDKTEAEKVKVSIALSGMPVVHFDNLEEGSMYGGSAIDSALTTTTIQDRILGSSDRPILSLRPAWYLSGNNVVPFKDAYRRWAVCNLVTELEYPERRADIEETDLRTHILEHRGEIVRDLLTILKAHALVDRPGAGWPPLGSFEEWDWVIRRAVWFATDRDCLATQQKTADESPDRLAKIALLEGWSELPGGRHGQGGITATEACQLVEKNPEKFDGLRAVLASRGRSGKPASSASLGFILRGLKNTPVGGFKLKENGKRHSAVCWVVEGIRGEDGEHREDDFCHSVRDFAPYEEINTNGESSSHVQRGPGGCSPSSPSSPSDISRIRTIVAGWPEGWCEEFGQTANRLHDQGFAWPADEIEAFARVSAEKSAAE